MSEGRTSPIDRLPVRDYNENPRKELRFVGENAAIRPIDFRDRVDMQRVRDLQAKQQEDFFIKEDLSDRQLINWMKNKSHTQDYLIFGVSGHKATSYENGQKTNYMLPEIELGELQGWIYVDKYTDRQVKELVSEGIIPEPSPGQPVLQIQHVKFPGTPDTPTANGQMASAIRQVMAHLGSLDYTFHEDRIQKEAKKEIGLDPAKPLDTMSVEELVAFRQQEKALWLTHPHKPTLSIIGTISSRNPNSMRVAEAAGRVRTGHKSSDPTIEEDEEYYYITDWDKLYEKMHQSALNEIQPGSAAQVIPNQKD